MNVYLLEVCRLTGRFLNFNCRFLFLFDLIICETISLWSFLFAKYRVYIYVRFRVVADSLFEIVAYWYIQSFVYSYSFVCLVDRARTSSSLCLARRTSKSTSTLFISVAKSQDLRRLTQIGICRLAFLFDFIIQEVISRVSSSCFVEVQLADIWSFIWSNLIWQFLRLIHTETCRLLFDHSSLWLSFEVRNF